MNESAPGGSKGTLMKRVRIGIIIAAVVVLLIVVLQNLGSVEARILFARVTMPIALLILSTTAIGFVLGVAAVSLRGRRDRSE